VTSRKDEPCTITVQGEEVAVVEEFVYPGSLIHSTHSSPDISRHNDITRAWKTWKSRIQAEAV